MSVVLAWLRLELRRRWRSLTVLALLVAVSSGVVMTSLAAARRGASAVTRMTSRTEPATMALLPNTPGFDWSKVAALPEVTGLAKFVVDYSITIKGIGGDGLGFPWADNNFGKTLEVPIIFAGRMYNPANPDEAVVTRKFLSHFHKHVGDILTIELPSAKQLADALAGGNGPTTYLGPAVPVRIVGVGLSPWLSDAPDSAGGLLLSPAFTAKYTAEVIGPPGPDNTQFINALVRLRHGAADKAKFNDDLRRVTGRSDLGGLDLVQQQRDLQHQIAFESRCLVAFALAAFVAALFLVGQAITRYAAANTVELQTLRALGMTPNQSAVTAAFAPVIVALIGAAGGMVAAWFASRWFPFGTAYYYEPTPGRQWDWLVMLPLSALVLVLVAAGAAGAARLAVRAARRNTPGRRSSLATALGRSGVGVPIAVGARFALEAGRGRTAVPVRPALIGAFAGVLGVVAAFTFSSGVSDAASHPERFGQTFQLAAFIGLDNQDYGPGAKVAANLVTQPEVTGVDDARTAVATAPGGTASVSLWEYETSSKPVHVVVLDGSLPSAADEVMLAPKSITALHTHVGGTVDLVGSSGARRTLHVVGSGFVPIGPHNGYADGGWITRSGYDQLFKGFKFHLILVSIKPGLNVTAAANVLAGRINKALPEVHGQAQLQPGEVPAEVAEIRQVRTLPIFLGGFLAVLALAAVGHALATAVRRRSHDLAVLRAVGMTPWQCRGVVVTQATTLALIGLIFGVPVGLATGRAVWRAVADYTPLQYVPPFAIWAMLLIGPAALLVANALAAWPGRRAARLRIAHVLRAE